MKFMMVQEAATEVKVNGADQVAAYMRDVAAMDRESVWVIHLNTRLHVIEREMISMGTVSGALAHPREVFKGAIVRSASAIIMVHNHPSGDPTPSTADFTLTKNMVRAAKILEIDFLDHVIVTPNGKAYSFAEHGTL